MKYIIKESQYVYLLENLDKNKKFLNNLMGMDFTGKIKQVTSSYDVPMEFDDVIGPDGIRRYLNFWGPMYLIEIDGMRFLYQDRVHTDIRFEWFLGEDGIDYVDNEIPEKLGIDIIGLRFSDILDMYFNEGEVVTENEDKVLRSRVQRRLGFIDQYMSELDPNDVCDYWTDGEVDYYVISSMQNAVEKVCDEIGNYDLYDEIYEYLADNGYKSQFRDFFIDTKNNFC
jgi:hypothetical protein